MVLNFASNSRFLTESMVKYGAESPVELIFFFQMLLDALERSIKGDPA